jgi:hypothetical protein
MGWGNNCKSKDKDVESGFVSDGHYYSWRKGLITTNNKQVREKI